MKDVIKRLQERYHYALVVFKELVKTNFKGGLAPLLLPAEQILRDGKRFDRRVT